MHLDDFDFDLPEELIAQTPAPERDASRLMKLDRSTGTISCGMFRDIVASFHAGDVLIFNDTRVIPARLLGHKPSGGKVEVFLVRPCKNSADGNTNESSMDWLCLTKSSRSLRTGQQVLFADDFSAEILEAAEAPYRRVRFTCHGDFMERVEALGHLPLPPYIKRDDDRLDRERYQTVFAREKGAVAAPTAGLHFTDEILAALKAKGVELCPVTLHVGLGTFLPVRVDNIYEHKMHAELYTIPAATAAAVNRARQQGRRIVALGTTSVRAVETAATKAGELAAGTGESEIFIYPGYKFKLIDALVTNFHLPKSTLLMLVSALAGRDFIFSAYRQAVEERFRFFSYGDCMMIA